MKIKATTNTAKMNNDEKIRIKNHPLFSYSVSVPALLLRHKL